MEQDYRKLCIELFGTDDAAQLRRIAENAKGKNPRGAGRRRRFSRDDVAEMRRLRAGGMKLADIAARFGTSRQVIGRYLNPGPEPGCTMRMTYMFRRSPCTVIDVDLLTRRVYIRNFTDDVIHRAFGVNEHPDWEDFEYFLRDRCFPESRGNRKSLLRQLGLTDYDPLQIVEKTQGRMADDDMWIRIQTYERSAEHDRTHRS